MAAKAILYATTVRVDAMTLLGEFLKTAPKNQGTRSQLVGKGKIGNSQTGLPNAPTMRELFGPDGRKVAADA